MLITMLMVMLPKWVLMPITFQSLPQVSPARILLSITVITYYQSTGQRIALWWFLGPGADAGLSCWYLSSSGSCVSAHRPAS